MEDGKRFQIQCVISFECAATLKKCVSGNHEKICSWGFLRQGECQRWGDMRDKIMSKGTPGGNREMVLVLPPRCFDLHVSDLGDGGLRSRRQKSRIRPCHEASGTLK